MWLGVVLMIDELVINNFTRIDFKRVLDYDYVRQTFVIRTEGSYVGRVWLLGQSGSLNQVRHREGMVTKQIWQSQSGEGTDLSQESDESVT